MEQEIVKTFEESANIYNHIGDQLSKDIFKNRIMYSMSGDMNYIRNIILNTDEGCALHQMIETRDNKYIFGTGYWCDLLMRFFPSDWKGCIDNDPKKWGGTVDGITIYSPASILTDSFTGSVYIMTRKYNEDIYSQLVNKYNMSDYQIVNVGRMINSMFERQYFDIDVIKHSNDEVFIDAGCFDGMTSRNFIDWSKNNFKRIYCFEPSGEGVERIKANLKSFKDKVKILPYACWNKKENLKFSINDNVAGASKISEDGIDVEASSIDCEIPNNLDVTFIKMDIEGAELKALKGAEQTIKRCHPKLAICIYHKPEDVITLADEILTIDDSYKLYFRHYSLSEVETVMYAI